MFRVPPLLRITALRNNFTANKLFNYNKLIPIIGVNIYNCYKSNEQIYQIFSLIIMNIGLFSLGTCFILLNLHRTPLESSTFNANGILKES